MSIKILKEKLSALDANAQRQLTAFLESLQDARNDGCLRLPAQRIDRPVADFATLEQMDRRLNFPESKSI